MFMGANENGDIWKFFAESTLAKGPRAITLTKVKGHASQGMVDEGKVDEEQKKGNDGADEGANKGAEEEQQGLSTVVKNYARFMARIHCYIIQ